MARKFAYYSSYQYAANKPVWAIDLDGLEDLIATVHGSWWADTVNEYLDNGDGMSALAAVIVGTMITKEMTASPAYADENWGINNSSPIGIEANQMEYANITDTRKNIQENGSVTIQLHYSGHDERGSLIDDGTAMIGRTIEIRDAPGAQDNIGLDWYIGNFIINYSGFGKAISPHVSQTGRHPWTGDKMDENDKMKMTAMGVADLLTMGITVRGAVKNQGLNFLQEVLNNALPGQLEEIGIGREAYDILASGNKVELISNMIQAGLITEELINKHFSNSAQDEARSIDKKSYIFIKE